MTSSRSNVAATSLLLALSVSGCASIRLESVGRADPAGAPYAELDRDEAATVVRVFRGGAPLPPERASSSLQEGDEVETLESGVAVVSFPGRGKVVLAPRTRVRIGSLEVLFGRIFASIRGLFTADSDDIVAGVEGTEFKLEVAEDRTVRVVVHEGVVTCRSKSGSWPTAKVHAGNAFSSPYPHRKWEMAPASPAELRDIARWMPAGPAPEPEPRARGYCCLRGQRQVFPSDERECRARGGVLFPDERRARTACNASEPVY